MGGNGPKSSAPAKKARIPRRAQSTLDQQPAKGSVCVGAATQTEWKAFAVDDKLPQMGGRFTAALVQRARGNNARSLADLVKDLTVGDTFEHVYKTKQGETLDVVARKHFAGNGQALLDHPRNRRLKNRKTSQKLPVGTAVWIANKVPFPTSAYLAGRKTATSKKPNNFALLCPNPDYSNSRYEADLPGATHDGRHVFDLLNDRGNIDMTLDANPTADRIKKSVKRLLEKGHLGDPKRGDEVCFFYSGHGVPEGLRCAQDGPGGIVEVRTFVDLAKEAYNKGLRLTILLDSCHSGAICDAIRRQAIALLEKQVTDRKHKEILKQVRELQKYKDQLAAVENKINKVLVEGDHLLYDVTAAKKSGDAAKISVAEQKHNKYAAGVLARTNILAKQTKDAWFGSLPGIKKALDEIKKNGGPSAGSAARYRTIQGMLKNTGDRSKFDRWWTAKGNNRYNDLRPQELDDLDDVMNAALEHVRR